MLKHETELVRDMHIYERTRPLWLAANPDKDQDDYDQWFQEQELNDVHDVAAA